MTSSYAYYAVRVRRKGEPPLPTPGPFKIAQSAGYQNYLIEAVKPKYDAIDLGPGDYKELLCWSCGTPTNYNEKVSIVDFKVGPQPVSKEIMTFAEYQKRAHETAIYPPLLALPYVGIALVGEAGEVANKIKKIIRDKCSIPTYEDKVKLGGEIGGCLWYLAELATLCQLDLGEIALQNLQILASRKERGVLGGSGDDR